MQYNHKKKSPGKNIKKQTNSMGKLWIWGTHAAKAALGNPRRHIFTILASRNAYSQLDQTAMKLAGSPVAPQRITDSLPAGAVHQGLAVEVAPLPAISLEQILTRGSGPIMVLDGITDPRNIGAIFRSSAAFGARAIIAQDRHMPPLSGVLAKTAVGAVEILPFIPVVNLSRTLEALADANVQTVGLAGETETSIADIKDQRPVALVMGAEGKGLRPNVRKHCETIARIPIAPQMESLNVASAASIALYEITRR
jgi:23S rRNA (guanosine2251-2'-O)-methyltransferase